MKTQAINQIRRRLLASFGLIGGLFAVNSAQAHHTATHFEDTVSHKLIMNCNKADEDYLSHTLFSVAELIRKYGDDIQIVVECYGAGIQLLGKKPTKPIAAEWQSKAASLNQYGVAFHACHNTMKALNWHEDDLLPFAKIVDAGIEDIMLLQEQGFVYAAW